MLKKRWLQLVIVSIVLGFCMSIASQFIWKTQTQPSPDSQLCMGANGVSMDSIDACGSPIQSTTTKGFPFSYSRTTITTTYQRCDSACPQTPSTQTRTSSFHIGSFIASWISWSAIVSALLVLALIALA